MAKDLVSIAKRYYKNHYNGEDIISINRRGDKEERSVLFVYNKDLGIWEELNKMVIRKRLMLEDSIDTPRSRNTVLQNLATLIEITQQENKDFEFNRDRSKIVLQNGVFDLETMKLGGYDRELYSTIRLPFEYDESAECPQFLAFLEEIMEDDDEMVQFHLEWLGYLFAPTTKYEAMMVWIGEGANGKSALSKLYKMMLGSDNISNIRLTNLYKPGAALRMENKLVNFSVETEMGRDQIVLDTGIVKNIVSGEEVTAKKLYRDLYEFRPFARQILICNDMPIVKDTSEGWIRRLHMVPFNYFVPKEKRIPDIEKELFKEASGIFNLAMQHYTTLEKRGRFELPKRVLEAVEQYQIENNSPAEYVLEFLEEIEGEEMEYSDFHEGYRDWCIRLGYKPFGYRNFWKQIERFFRSRKEYGVIPIKRKGAGNVTLLSIVQGEKEVSAHDEEKFLKILDD